MPKIGEDSKYRLYNESCFDTFKRIKPGSIDLVLVDPPYGTTQCKWDSIIPLEPMWKELLYLVKDNSGLVFTASQPFTSNLVMSRITIFRHRWAWIRGKRKAGVLDANRKPLKTFEDIVVFGIKRPNYYPQKTEGVPYTATSGKSQIYGKVNERAIHSNVTSRFPTDVVNIDPDDARRRVHPTQKPVALMEYLIKTYSNEGDLVLDFAMGSGTTGVACGNLNRRFIGCDNDKEHGYFEIAKKRIQEAYAKHG